MVRQKRHGFDRSDSDAIEAYCCTVVLRLSENEILLPEYPLIVNVVYNAQSTATAEAKHESNTNNDRGAI
jgi:hypothetical protein